MQDSSAAGNASADPADLPAGPGADPGADSGMALGTDLGADPVDAARRLGAALERIARLAPRAHAGSEGEADPAPDPALAEIAARLDRLIAQLRGVIAESGGIQS